MQLGIFQKLRKIKIPIATIFYFLWFNIVFNVFYAFMFEFYQHRGQKCHNNAQRHCIFLGPTFTHLPLVDSQQYKKAHSQWNVRTCKTMAHSTFHTHTHIYKNVNFKIPPNIFMIFIRAHLLLPVLLGLIQPWLLYAMQHFMLLIRFYWRLHIHISIYIQKYIFIQSHVVCWNVLRFHHNIKTIQICANMAFSIDSRFKFNCIPMRKRLLDSLQIAKRTAIDSYL